MLLKFVVVFFLIQLIILAATALHSIYYHKFCHEVNFVERYGRNSWIVITGGSSGQGRRFALEFASRGFNLLLIGSKRSFDVQREIKKLHENVEVRVLLKDFAEAWQTSFFDEVKVALSAIPEGKLAFLLNNVGHRVAYRPHHSMPEELIADTIACGTITQAMMTRLCLPYLLKRETNVRSGIIFITAQVIHPTHTFGIAMIGDLPLPYLAAYEASNAFGYHHARSIYKEYKSDPDNIIDMLIVTPGAVLTSNTEHVLEGTLGAINDKEFVENVMRLIGNVSGVWSGSFEQGLLLWMIGLVPPIKDYVLHKTGKRIAESLMANNQTRRRIID